MPPVSNSKVVPPPGRGPRPRRAAEHAVEDVLETAATAAAKPPAGAEGVGLEAARPARARRIAAGKALEARLALGVDLAAIELLALCPRRR